MPSACLKLHVGILKDLVRQQQMPNGRGHHHDFGDKFSVAFIDRFHQRLTERLAAIAPVRQRPDPFALLARHR